MSKSTLKKRFCSKWLKIKQKHVHCEDWTGILDVLWFQVSVNPFRSAPSQSWLCPFNATSRGRDLRSYYLNWHFLKKCFYYFRLSTSLRDSMKLQLWLRQPSTPKMTSTPALMQITTPLQNGLRWQFFKSALLSSSCRLWNSFLFSDQTFVHPVRSRS